MIICDICEVVCKVGKETYVDEMQDWERLKAVRHVCSDCEEILYEIQTDVAADFSDLMNDELAKRIKEHGARVKKTRESMQRRKKRMAAKIAEKNRRRELYGEIPKNEKK